MCGIAGFIDTDMSLDDKKKNLSLMLQTILHRGPDDAGTWLDVPHGVALGHSKVPTLLCSIASPKKRLRRSRSACL